MASLLFPLAGMHVIFFFLGRELQRPPQRQAAGSFKRAAEAPPELGKTKAHNSSNDNSSGGGSSGSLKQREETARTPFFAQAIDARDL